MIFEPTSFGGRLYAGSLTEKFYFEKRGLNGYGHDRGEWRGGRAQRRAGEEEEEEVYEAERAEGGDDVQPAAR